MPKVTGVSIHCPYSDHEARFDWHDGWMDALRGLGCRSANGKYLEGWEAYHRNKRLCDEVQRLLDSTCPCCGQTLPKQG